jgi:hypothetical protein
LIDRTWIASSFLSGRGRELARASSRSYTFIHIVYGLLIAIALRKLSCTLRSRPYSADSHSSYLRLTNRMLRWPMRILCHIPNGTRRGCESKSNSFQLRIRRKFALNAYEIMAMINSTMQDLQRSP